jgi:hypothetical protein
MAKKLKIESEEIFINEVMYILRGSKIFTTCGKLWGHAIGTEGQFKALYDQSVWDELYDEAIEKAEEAKKALKQKKCYMSCGAYKCKNMTTKLEDCGHFVCKECTFQYIKDQYGNEEIDECPQCRDITCDWFPKGHKYDNDSDDDSDVSDDDSEDSHTTSEDSDTSYDADDDVWWDGCEYCKSTWSAGKRHCKYCDTKFDKEWDETFKEPEPEIAYDDIYTEEYIRENVPILIKEHLKDMKKYEKLNQKRITDAKKLLEVYKENLTSSKPLWRKTAEANVAKIMVELQTYEEEEECPEIVKERENFNKLMDFYAERWRKVQVRKMTPLVVNRTKIPNVLTPNIMKFIGGLKTA